MAGSSSKPPESRKGARRRRKEAREAQKELNLSPEEEKFGSAYDRLEAQGVPTYAVWARPRNTTGEAWIPAGVMAVPRNMRVDDLIFQNELQLKQGIVRLYPKLSGQTADLEYGYNLKIYPDEPVKVAKRRMFASDENEGNPFASWIQQLTNPLNTQSLKSVKQLLDQSAGAVTDVEDKKEQNKREMDQEGGIDIDDYLK
uniref:Uncharacterized protein n=1 Tax=Chromera velia CCMP2878 TaxID=1169474 RepID=A0A0G4IC94_9ALVE|eukprot:Cvel_13071.t1-p1 / transcript=Cvel_13071.t1 / gene=Cvel_13071 / organism=Chromera_velia_CCMP2878 / gene_product=hypothetical protein / transcript_product=hypothetical protein / location=Cvel_scaffold880:19962-22537(+) / protein_length=199 / sequence_SO=supercontig / SO=protein_coding / is_pseudo=false